ncbi:unnamed protein product [Sphagnum troendelagicum]|uniref:Uncharacterized protein n=1 Tax=Sphagnum troendelagicum TaxID=128251 RepID=A0ABP0T9H1_9BRYO
MVPEEDCITTRAMQKILAKEEEKETTSRISCRSPQVELIRRELMAVKKKVRSLQDPSATTVFSFDTQQQLFSTLDHHTCSSVTRLSWSKENTAAAAAAWVSSGGPDELLLLSQPLVVKKKTRRNNKSTTRRLGAAAAGAVQLGNGQWRLGTPARSSHEPPRWRPSAASSAGNSRGILELDHRKQEDAANIKECIGVDGGDGGIVPDHEPGSAHFWNEEQLLQTQGEKAAAQEVMGRNEKDVRRGGRNIHNRNARHHSPQCGGGDQRAATKEEVGAYRRELTTDGRQEEDTDVRIKLISGTSSMPCPGLREGESNKLEAKQQKKKKKKKWDSSVEEQESEFEAAKSSSRMCNKTEELSPPREASVDDVGGSQETKKKSHQGEEEGFALPRYYCWWSRLRKYKSKKKKRLLAFLRRGLGCVFAVAMRIKREKKLRVARRNSFSRLTTTSSSSIPDCCDVPAAAAPTNKPPEQSTRKTLQSFLDGVQRIVGDSSESGEISVSRRRRRNPETAMGTSLSERSIPTCEPLPEFGCNLTRSRGGRDLGEEESRIRVSAAATALASERELTNDRAPSPEVQDWFAVKEEEEKMHHRLSQKYRPKSFKDLVGQTLVVRSLVNAITKGKVVPVYLFSGPHGTGKTSAARVFAAALVCLAAEPHRRPCGLCKECATSFTSLHTSLHVREVDAANELEMEHLRALLGSMSLSCSSLSSHSRYQVFIIEHCNFLITEIWSTFLKFLEEPPPDVVLILIATDPDSLPLTAISRCQRFLFAKLKDTEIVSRLQMLATKENLEVDMAALSLIASRADGSLRDAESILDQLSILDKKVSLAIVQELVGLIPDDMLLDLLDLALSADTINIVRCTRKLLDLGVDALSLIAQLASLITKILGGNFDVHRETCTNGFFRRDLCAEEQRQLRRALKVLLESEKQLRVSHDQTTWVTAALLQFAPDRSYIPSSVDTSMSPLRKGGDNNSSSDEITQSSSSLLYDRSHGLLTTSSDFQLLARGDLEDVWTKVLHSYRSNVLRQLMQAQGTLVSLAVAKDTRNAIAHVEFEHPEHKARAERLQSSTCHAFQMALGCPVELKFSLASLQKTVLEDSKELPLRQDAIVDSHPNSSLSSSSEQSKLKAQIRGWNHT